MHPSNQLSSLGRYTLLCIASLTVMVGALVAPGLLSIANGLGVNGSPTWLMTLPSLGAVVCAPIAGKVIDRYGAYSCLIIGLFLYGAIGAFVFVLYGPIPVFINRFALGGVTAIVMASGTVLISEWYTDKERLGMMAQQGMAIELGGVIFLFLGGQLAVQHWGLPLSLYLAGWVFLAMLLFFVPRHSPQFEDESKGDGSAALTLNYFSLKKVYLCTTLAMLVFFSCMVVLPIAMHQQGYREEQVGYLLALISSMAVVSALFMPRLERRLGQAGLLISAFALYAFAYWCFGQASLWVLVLGALFVGTGFGFSIPLLNHMTVERSPAAVRGRNLSYFTMAIFSGQFLTSFIELIPGDINNVFIACMGAASLVALLLLISRFQQKGNP
ncbi:MFS transporter [Marinomonas algarum]|uniref:MFS transporter n=1 Tax=Marinomonas algarum TaxID=2883105 RepID=A0A9X1LF91_9GAMM|nr:MFS transporter [Marinomonas algarum]MCB5162688.1 MFS transporter [Marinomonas algarum]